ncbi:lytic transglycosylase domain-containing protein [Thalassobacillus hwangdonensis]|uniref:Lytic transglycosylase domain-containing protein n=1 Tax=Thalassobacillus hwangdonensis TaxID=546108 RepID=A0ABW3L0S2_9BACI
MTVLKTLFHVGLTTVIVAMIVIVVNDHHQQEKKTILAEKKTLAKTNEDLLEQNEQLLSQKEYMSTERKKSAEQNGYFSWNEMEGLAEMLVEDSEGRFKKSWALYLVREATKYEVDPFLAYELLKVETGRTFDPELVGPKTKYGHAYGMAQFMKNTAPWIAEMAGLPYKEELLFDPYYSMQLSLVYLDYLHNEYGNWDEALTAYHRGMGGLEEYKKKNGHANSWYAEAIQEGADNYQTVAYKE